MYNQKYAITEITWKNSVRTTKIVHIGSAEEVKAIYIERYTDKMGRYYITKIRKSRKWIKEWVKNG